MTYEFSGYGNYSHSFGWDNGLSARISHPVEFGGFDSIYQCWKEVGVFAGPSHNVAGTFETTHGRLFYFINENGGSRNVHGEVCAVSPKLAQRVLQAFCDTFPVIEYDRQ